MTPTGTFPDILRMQSVRRRLARWRQTRVHPRAPIPAAVWAAAVKLARQYGVYQTARALPLDYGALKKHLEATAAPASALPTPTFVELAPGTPRPGPECVIEFDAPRGTTRLRVSGLALAEVVVLTRALGGREA